MRVATAQNQPEAELIQGLLLEAGIPSLVRRSGGFDVPTSSPPARATCSCPCGGGRGRARVLGTGAAAAAPRAARARRRPGCALALALALLVLALVAAGVLAAILSG